MPKKSAGKGPTPKMPGSPGAIAAAPVRPMATPKVLGSLVPGEEFRMGGSEYRLASFTEAGAEVLLLARARIKTGPDHYKEIKNGVSRETLPLDTAVE